jgi:hypothetical protein
VSLSGRRITSSVSISVHGMNAYTLLKGQASQTTKNVPNANTTPLSSAPPERIPSTRANRKVPNAATNSFRTATTASDFQNGST